MPIFKDTVMIKDRQHDRAVEVTVTTPEGVSVLNVQELAHHRQGDGEGARVRSLGTVAMATGKKG
jgi:hypothetical protein